MKITAKDKDKLDEIKRFLDKAQQDPYHYFKKAWGINLYEKDKPASGSLIWSLQHQLLEAIPQAIKENKPIYIASGHSLGKDYICGRIAPWFLQCFRPSIVLLTGPTDRQVQHTMFKEVSTAWEARKIDLGGKIFTKPRIEIDKDWYLLGFTTKETGATKEGGGGKFQSFHSPNMCVVVTEAQSVEDNIYDQIDGCATGQNILRIFLGNPTRAKGRFAAGIKDKKNNIVFNFSCLENPNYLERRQVIPGLASYEWVEDKRRKWGENDPRWIGRVLGQVPANALNFVFNEEILNLAYTKHGHLAQYSTNRGVAVDVAGEGVDENVLMAGSGGEVMSVYKRTLMTPAETALKAIEMCREIKGNFIIVDCDGMGIRDYQQLESMTALTQGIQLIKFHGSARAGKDDKNFDPITGRDKDKSIYENVRAEASFIAQKRVKDGQAAINPEFRELIEDLSADEWFENNQGRIQLIDKTDIKEVLERSPGCGDAYKMLQWAFDKGIERNNTLNEDFFGDNNVLQYCKVD